LNTFISGAADATIKVWRLTLIQERLAVADSIESIPIQPRFFPLALALAPLDEDHTSFVLAVGGTKSIIQIYVTNDIKATVSFSLKATLSGHEGWIRSLDFVLEAQSGGDILLASASQDKYVRLWRLHQDIEAPATDVDSAVISSSKTLSNKAYNFEIGSRNYFITFEALLLGHEDWIYTAVWKRNGSALHLLTASADNTLSIWDCKASSGVWVVTTRVGELSAQKGSTTATGSTGGFWIGLWSPRGDSVVSLGRTGSWRLWTRDQASKIWLQHSAISGHTKAAKAVAWERDGAYLLSTRSDSSIENDFDSC
jgi:elongator complex protein 2